MLSSIILPLPDQCLSDLGDVGLLCWNDDERELALTKGSYPAPRGAKSSVKTSVLVSIIG